MACMSVWTVNLPALHQHDKQWCYIETKKRRVAKSQWTLNCTAVVQTSEKIASAFFSRSLQSSVTFGKCSFM